MEVILSVKSGTYIETRNQGEKYGEGLKFRARNFKEGITTVLNTSILIQQPVELAEGVEWL